MSKLEAELPPSDTDIDAADGQHASADSSPAGADAADRSRRPAKSLPERVLDFASGFGLTVLILLFLMVLTYFGTIAQKDMGLVRAQEKYFDSFFVFQEVDPGWQFGPFRGFWLPGAFLLLIVLSINLLLGGLIRIKWSARTSGILIGHLGIVLLLIAGLVKFTSSTNGALRINPGEVSSVYQSFHEWEMSIGEQRGDGRIREHLIGDMQLRRRPIIRDSSLPFEIAVFEYFDNCEPRNAQASLATNVVDGLFLEKQPTKGEMQAFPGASIEVRVPGQEPVRGLLWGLDRAPMTVKVGGVPWTIDLRKRLFDLPFKVRLEKFRKEEHPGITTPRHFSSDVTKIEDGVEQPFHVAMNEPMRYGGFMLSQNNWGSTNPRSPNNPQDGPPPYYTVLEVSSNPSDQWPKYACYVIAFGLLWHFLRKLIKHVEKQNKVRRTA